MQNVSTFIDSMDKEWVKRDGYSYLRLIDHQLLGVNHNALLVRCQISHPRRRVLQGTRLYFVLSGEGKFVVDGTIFTMGPQMQVVIQTGQEYEYSGVMLLYETNVNIGPGDLHEDLE